MDSVVTTTGEVMESSQSIVLEKKKGLHTGKVFQSRFVAGLMNCQDFLGAFYECTDRESGEACTIRLWSGAVTTDPPLIEVLHPNIVTAEALSAPGKVPRFAVYESDVQLTLREWMRLHRRPAPGVILSVMAQLCGAVEALHGKGVVHGALCPETIFIGVNFTGQLEVCLPDLRFTISASSIAAKAYQSAGRLDGACADVRDDVRALGVMLYEAFFSRRPFNGKTVEELRAALSSDPSFSGREDLTASAVALMKKALQPDGGYGDASGFGRDLQQVADEYAGGAPVFVTPTAAVVVPDRAPKAERTPVETDASGERLLDDLSTSEIDLVELRTGRNPALAAALVAKANAKPAPAPATPPPPFEVDIPVELEETTRDVSTMDVEIIGTIPATTPAKTPGDRRRLIAVAAAVLLLLLVGIVLLTVLSARDPGKKQKKATPDRAHVSTTSSPAAEESTAVEVPAEQPVQAPAEPAVAPDAAPVAEPVSADEETAVAEPAAEPVKAVPQEESPNRTAEPENDPRPSRRKGGGWATNPFGE